MGYDLNYYYDVSAVLNNFYCTHVAHLREINISKWNEKKSIWDMIWCTKLFLTYQILKSVGN